MYELCLDDRASILELLALIRIPHDRDAAIHVLEYWEQLWVLKAHVFEYQV